MRVVGTILAAALTLLVPACLPTQQKAGKGGKAAKTAKNNKKAGKSTGGTVIPDGPVDFPTAPPLAFTAHPGKTGNEYSDRFIAMWNDLHNPANGYFSPEGVPYHAAETMVVEAPDYGHETTSEAYSYWMWLEAAYGKFTKDWKPLEQAWKSTEAYVIPTEDDQPTAGSYNDTHPAVYSPEQDLPQGYPSPLDSTAPVGKDPLAKELQQTYGSPFIYGMHWILDVDNWYGFGRRGDRVSKPAYINTFQRGKNESVWEALPQPCWEDFQFGGPNGFLDLFVKQDGGYTRQWKYTNAPDADARAVQAMYWAKVWADEQGAGATIDEWVKKTAKMGDFLRYALFDKYFKTMGCQTPTCPPADDGYGAAHYLLSWYYAWGGSTAKQAGWSWRIGSSFAHGGYQNPFAAYVLAQEKAFKPLSPNAQRDWSTSLDRQLEFYRWLQSAEGGIGGGATNSWDGRYAKPPAGRSTFYKMAYDEAPVYMDPPSNEWFGFQAWSIDRVAQLYYVTGDKRAKVILDRWVRWAWNNTKLLPDDGFEIPSTLAWSGQPSLNWNEKTQDWTPGEGYNKNLHVKIKDYGTDIGVAASLARTMLFYSAKSGNMNPARKAKELLDRIWKKYRDNKGVGAPEERKDYSRFGEALYIPTGWKGKMPNGDTIDSNSTFLSIRTRYKSDPDWPKVDAYLKGGAVTKLTVHRFWAQVDVATANATMATLFPNGVPAKSTKPEAAAPAAKAPKAKRGKKR